jgi:hypothetical protein
MPEGYCRFLAASSEIAACSVFDLLQYSLAMDHSRDLDFVLLQSVVDCITIGHLLRRYSTSSVTLPRASSTPRRTVEDEVVLDVLDGAVVGELAEELFDFAFHVVHLVLTPRIAPAHRARR